MKKGKQAEVPPTSKPGKKAKVVKEKPNSEGLTFKQQAFVDAYFGNGMNATMAWLELHPKSNYNSARSQSSLELTNLNVAAAITKRLKEKAMGVDELIARYGEMARADTLPFIRVTKEGFVYFNFNDPRARAHMYLVKEIESKRTRRIENKEVWEDEWVKVKLHDAQHAMDQIGKLHKLWADVDVSASLTITNLDDILEMAYGKKNNGSGSDTI